MPHNTRAERIGILGGGQLASMLCQAAAKLGYQTVIFCPDATPPALSFSDQHIQSDYGDLKSLRYLAEICHVVTCEFENVSADTLDALDQLGTDVRPSAKAFAISQDRFLEKTHFRDINISTAPFRAISTQEELYKAFDDIGPGILKTRRFGYDGRGQFRLDQKHHIDAIDLTKNDTGWIYEGYVDFSHEVSVIVARGTSGDMSYLPMPTNIHQHGILRESRIPSRETSAEIQKLATEQAYTLAKSLEYCGTLAVEFFITTDGILVANEFAPRVHNSGHWSRELCSHDQFALHILAITGQTLPSVKVLFPGSMYNIIGEDVSIVAESLPESVSLTDYGKADVRTGRKMGHYVISETASSHSSPAVAAAKA